jgi:hypothetical protein
MEKRMIGSTQRKCSLSISRSFGNTARIFTLRYGWLWRWREIDSGMTIPAR